MRLRRGFALAAGIAVALLLLAVLAAAILMQPQRLARLVLGGVGSGLGLEIGFEGQARYRLRGTPMLEVRDLVVHVPGDTRPMLRASRALVSLPWSTVRNRGGAPLLLHGVELDAPVLDLPQLQGWLATRPPGDGPLPTLSEGITVRDGRVLADGWEVRGLELRLPRFAPGTALAAQARGLLLAAAPSRLHFDLRLAATEAANGAGIGARGQVRLEHDGWQLPATVVASGPLRVDGGTWRVTPLQFGASGEYRGDGEPLPFALGAYGPLRLREGAWTLVPAAVALRGAGVVPSFDARGRAALGGALLLELAGTLGEWPREWPPLPAPLHASTSPIDASLHYAGASNLSASTTLRLRRDDAEAEASGRLADILGWMDAAPTGSPLPPLRARASAPRIEVPGGVLEGVEIAIEPGEGE